MHLRYQNRYLNNIKAALVLDPTLLLKRADYIKLLKKEKVSQGNLFCYILDETSKKESLVKKIAELNGLKPFYVKSKETPSFKNCVKNIDECVIPGVLTWIQAFKDAELVVTDSFHGCVFSIIFNKRFITSSHHRLISSTKH